MEASASLTGVSGIAGERATYADRRGWDSDADALVAILNPCLFGASGPFSQPGLLKDLQVAPFLRASTTVVPAAMFAFFLDLKEHDAATILASLVRRVALQKPKANGSERAGSLALGSCSCAVGAATGTHACRSASPPCIVLSAVEFEKRAAEASELLGSADLRQKRDAPPSTLGMGRGRLNQPRSRASALPNWPTAALHCTFRLGPLCLECWSQNICRSSAHQQRPDARLPASLIFLRRHTSTTPIPPPSSAQQREQRETELLRSAPRRPPDEDSVWRECGPHCHTTGSMMSAGRACFSPSGSHLVQRSPSFLTISTLDPPLL
jgi:hypothetical protein